MYFIVVLIIVILSSILSFATSGIEHLVKMDDKNWYMIPLGYYFLFYSILILTTLKLKFKNIRILKFFLLKKILKFNRLINNIGSRVYSSKTQLTPLQERAIKIWNSLIEDKSSSLNACVRTHDRFIQKGTILIILKNNADQILTIIDSGKGSNLFYEVYIPNFYLQEMTLFFDKEQEKRMNSFENRKRGQLESQLVNVI